ncbi:MAG: GldG family protein, partial [Oscillospiraceae bacterium]|nr:GldG family protein [Oscillospiraceae bacterium]
MKNNIFRSRRFKHGTLATVMTAGFVALVVLVNVIVGLLVERFPMDIDLTDNKIFELSEESIDYLKGIDNEIEITVLAKETDFTAQNDYYNQANEIFKKYEKYGKNITLSYVDIYSDPTIAQKYPKETLGYGQIVVSSGDRYQLLDAYDLFNTQTSQTTGYTTIASSKAEQAMTSAIMFITDENPITVTVLNGFGTTGSTDISYLTDLLNSNGYLINEINLMTEDIPENTTIAILAAPVTDITETEADKLSAYLDNDGNLGKILYYFADASQPELPMLESLLEEWGIAFGDGYLAETDMNNIYMTNTVMMQQYGENETFTEGLNLSVPIVSYTARPMWALWPNNSNRYTEVLLSTYDSAVNVPADASAD